MSAVDVAVLVYDFRGSGVVRNALRIAAAARDAGLAVELWAMRSSGAMAGDAPAGVPVVEVTDRPAAGLSRTLDSLRSAGALARAVVARKPAVLLSAGNHIHLAAALAMREARRAGAPTLFVGRASNALIGTVPAGLPSRVVRALGGPVERFQYAMMDRIIAVSQELGDNLADLMPARAGRIAVIPNGVDLPAVTRRAAEPLADPWLGDPDVPVVLSIGRLSGQKNLPMLLRAFAIARQARPLRLVIVGHGPAATRDALIDLAGDLGIAADVRFTGFDPNPFRYLARAGLFALTSRWEGASNVAIEALAAGCPIVATACPTGMVEVLDGVAPLIAVDDDAAFARAMLARLDAPRDSARLKARAARYPLERTLGAYAAFLTRLAGREERRLAA